MRVKQIITALNTYLRCRDTESEAKRGKESARDLILNLLPPTSTDEWAIPEWGRVTYKTPKDSLAVDLVKLQAKFPKAYKACVHAAPNSPRFLVFPETKPYVEAMKGIPDHALSRL